MTLTILNIFKELLEMPAFIRNAFFAGIAIGILAPLVGTVVVIRRLSLIADTLSHFSLAGVAIGVFMSKLPFFTSLGFDPIIMGIAFSVVGTFLIEKLRGFYKNYKELSMPILMSLGVALSGMFIYLTPGISTNWTTGLLFGSIYSVDLKDIILILILSFFVLIFTILYYKKIVSLCFDEIYSRVSGINVKMIQLGITILLSLVISIFIDLVGVLLISSLMIIPVAAAILIGDSFKNTIVISIIFSEISIIFGFIISYNFKLPTGSTIVLFNLLILFIIMLIIRIRRVKYKNEDINKNDFL